MPATENITTNKMHTTAVNFGVATTSKVATSKVQGFTEGATPILNHQKMASATSQEQYNLAEVTSYTKTSTTTATALST